MVKPSLLYRLRKFDEATGHTAQATEFDEHTDNGLNADRTGHLHQAARQDNVFHWLDGAESGIPSAGQS